MSHDIAVAMVVLGTAVVVASTLGALLARDVYHRLHFATPITSLGGPLIAIGLSVDNGAGLTTASILFPTFLLFFSSPVLSAAIARTVAQREGRIQSEAPE
jgi:monovalent cation/proton antiporter MnhG/PhaG subunit